MAIFKDHRISINHLLRFIPEALITHLSLTTRIDHYSKVLHGKKMFYLLMYGILENDRLSQRTLEDSFNDPVFKVLFNLDESERVRRSSISDRLSKMEPDYFRQLYECIYDQFSELYSFAEKEKYNLIRVDSSMVSETVGKLLEGIDNKRGKKAVKYSIAFDGVLPCHSDVFTAAGYASEDIALPEAIMGHVKKDNQHRNIYVVDRGMQSARAMMAFNDQKVTFICRAKENRKFVEIESFMGANSDLDLGESTLLRDCKVQLYAGLVVHNKRGNKHTREVLSEGHFRLVVVESKVQADKTYWFLTNDFESPAKEIAQAYRRRWDIEAAVARFFFAF